MKFIHRLIICALFLIINASGQKVTGVNSSNEIMKKAYDDARENVGEFIAALEPPKTEHHYLVKFKVKADGHTEHMWIETLTYKDGIFTGKLANKPRYIESIKIGDTLSQKKRGNLRLGYFGCRG